MLSLPKEMILTIFNFLDDRSWLHLRLTCHHLNQLPKDEVKRHDDAYRRAQIALRKASANWSFLYQEIHGHVRGGTLTQNTWMILYTKVSYLLNGVRITPPETIIMQRCIKLLPVNEHKTMFAILRQYFRLRGGN